MKRADAEDNEWKGQMQRVEALSGSVAASNSGKMRLRALMCYCLFNDTVSSSDYITFICKM